MPDELKSFLMSVSVILAAALFVPCIESIVKFLRRGSQANPEPLTPSQSEPAKGFSREAA